MGFAKAAALRATCDRKHVGAVIVVGKQVVSTGYNGSIRGMEHCSEGPCEMESDEKWHPHDGAQGEFCRLCSRGNAQRVCDKNPGAGHDMENGSCVRTIHAEMNALAQAANHGTRVGGSSIYTTASPCWPCFRVLVNAGVLRFVYAEEYKAGGLDHLKRIRPVAEKLGLQVVHL